MARQAARITPTMPHSPFIPSREVRFDLAQGTVRVGETARVLVPAEALLALCRSAGSAAQKDFGHRLGAELGRRAVDRLSDGDATMAAVVEHFGGDLALLGLGSLSVERWGRALVLKVSDSPLGGEGDTVLASVLEGALQRGMSRDASLVPIERADGVVRFLVANPKAAEKVRGWLSDGVAWGDALARLNTQ